MSSPDTDPDQIEEVVKSVITNLEGGMEAVEQSSWTRQGVRTKVQSYKSKQVSDKRTIQAVANRIRQDIGRDMQQDARRSGDSSEEYSLIEDLTRDQNWANIVGTVSQDWGGNGGAVSQAGLLRDATGEIRFVSWTKSEVPRLEKGKTYQLSVLAVDEYKGDLSVNLNGQTEITEQAQDKLVQKHDVADGYVLLGKFVGERQRCGRKNCPEALLDQRCPRHGTVDAVSTVPEVRLVIDNGRTVREAVCDFEFLSALSDEENHEEFVDETGGESQLSQQIEQELIGLHVSLQGPLRGGKIVAEDWSQGQAPPLDQVIDAARDL